MERLVTIKFHKALQKYTNGIEEHSLMTSSYTSLLKSCMSLFPDLEKAVKKIALNSHTQELIFIVDGKLLDLDLLYFPAKGKNIILCPLIGGSSTRTVALVAIVVVIIVGVIVTGGAGAPAAAGALGASSGGTGAAAAGAAAAAAAATAASAGSLAINVVVGIVLSFALSQLIKAASPNNTESSDSNSRRNNDSFDALANTASPRTPIPLNYGEIRTAGQLASGYVKTINHGKNDNIIVGSFFI